MTGRPTNVVEDWTYGPARWLGAGLLAGAATVGIFWSVSARRVDAQQQSAPIDPPAARAPSQPKAGAKGTNEQERAKPEVSTTVPSTRPPVPSTPQPIVTQLAPRTVEPTAPVPASTITPEPKVTTASSRIINLNSATPAELETLPGIGPGLAARIAEDRAKNGRFKKVDDLDRVKGIGPKLLERIRPFATVE